MIARQEPHRQGLINGLPRLRLLLLSLAQRAVLASQAQVITMVAARNLFNSILLGLGALLTWEVWVPARDRRGITPLNAEVLGGGGCPPVCPCVACRPFDVRVTGRVAGVEFHRPVRLRIAWTEEAEIVPPPIPHFNADPRVARVVAVAFLRWRAEITVLRRHAIGPFVPLPVLLPVVWHRCRS